MEDREAWRLEERFWLEGASFHDAHLGNDCVMAFPAPFGILDRSSIGASLAEAPRWTAVAISERILARPDDTTLVLGYRAQGTRAGSPAYSAYCTSTYRFDARGWKLVQHQQTPIG